MATSKQAGYVCCSKEEKEDDTQHSSCECTSNMFKCMFPALIRCHKKVQACQWTGPLKDLDAHTCYYVDVECPKSCAENVQKQNYQDHSHGCLGNCEATIEQDSPKSHDVIQVSSEQKVPCELSCTVCEATTLRISQEQQHTLETKFEGLKQEFQEHVKVKIQELVLVEMMHKDDSKQETDIQHQKLVKAKDEQITELKKKITDVENKHELDAQEVRKQQADLETAISEHKEEFQRYQQELDIRFGTIETTKRTKRRMTSRTRTYTLVDYKKCKSEKKKIMHSLKDPKDPTYPDLSLWIYPNGTKEGTDSHLSLTVSLPPNNKDQSDHPSSLTITVELQNQRGDQNHVTVMKKEFVHFRLGFPEQDMSDIKFISLADLELNEDKQTQYLKKNDSLSFIISTEIQSILSH